MSVAAIVVTVVPFSGAVMIDAVVISGASLGDARKLEMTKGLLKPTEEFNHILKRIKRNYPGSAIEVRD